MGERYDFLRNKMVSDKPKKRAKAPEAKVGAAIDVYLKGIGAYIRTIKSDGTKMNDGRWRTSNQGRGISDRIGILPGGRFIAVELKAEGKKRTATEEQLGFLSRIVSLGGVGCVADSVESVRLALSQTKEEMQAALDELRIKTAMNPLFVEDLFQPDSNS